MNYRVIARIRAAAAALPLCFAATGCGAGDPGSWEEGDPDLAAEESGDVGEVQQAACPVIGPGCPTPLPPLPPLPPPPGCAISPAGAVLPGPGFGVTLSATSPTATYGSTSCANRWIVEFGTAATRSYTVPTPSLDLVVTNELTRAACLLTFVNVKVLGLSNLWREVTTLRYHGTISGTACVAQPEQGAPTLTGYSKIRTAVQRGIWANGTTQFVHATGSLRGL